MSDDLQNQAKPAKAERKQQAPAVAKEWPKFLRSHTRFQYTDPETGVRYSPTSPVRVDVAPEKGSWLASQMEAGFVGEA